MSGELPGPGRSSSHHDDAVGRGRFRPQPSPQLLAGWSGHACSEVGRAAEDQIGDLLGGAGLHPLAHVLVGLGGDQDAGVTQPFPQAVFTLIRQFAETLAVFAYTSDHLEYIESLIGNADRKQIQRAIVDRLQVE